ncbi:MAG: pyridoxamine 5'-phosphate oxidase [Sphingomonadales bacterium]|nr:MAG: pyridoxamine 5'-phosphate oxidase [Sphingomonadales bacterium]
MAKTLAEIAEMMRDIDFAMLSTHSDGGTIASRPMSNNRDVEYDGDNWFFSLANTRLIDDIRANPKVSLGFQAKAGFLKLKPVFVSIEGTAAILTDKAVFKEHWNTGLDLYFEDGIDTAGLVLIHVRGDRAHYWDGDDQGDLVLAGASPESVATPTG